MNRCDFCGVYLTDSCWSYPAKDVLILEPIPMHLVGGWCACLDCHTLISNNHQREVAERSVKVIHNTTNPPTSLINLMYDCQKAFFDYRDGSPTFIPNVTTMPKGEIGLTLVY